MSSTLKNAAVAAVTKCQPSIFYDREHRPNPVLHSLEQELKTFFSFVRKRLTLGYVKTDEESHMRLPSTLFDLLNKYEPRLPVLYYQQKLLEIGDFLVSMKEHKIAMWHCYDRYLHIFGDAVVEEAADVARFQQTFYPKGFQAENAELTSRALMGKALCMYQVVRQTDHRLQNKQSVDKCLEILSFLRLVTQIILPRDSQCWLVYNGTIHIYSICRQLMTLGHSAKVLEYLLWASMCMETSVPLLSVKYLSWRATLYTAVCQCYYDCKAGEQAENFARRGLVKIEELSNLELLSSGKGMVVYEDSVRSATVKMAIMVFKRNVIESRRKPKGILRPKTRANLKETLNLPWPRNPTEVMLSEMFDGGSAQFLAILESLSNSNRRILQTSPPASDSDPEILDIYGELLMAAQEILAGGGGNRPAGVKSQLSSGAVLLASVTMTGSLIQSAIKGEGNIPLESVISLVKLAYAYEQWEVFEALLAPVLAMIKESKDGRLLWEEKTLILLSAMSKVNVSRQKKPNVNTEETEVHKTSSNISKLDAGKRAKTKPKSSDKVSERPPEQEVSVKIYYGDELIRVADALMSIVTGPCQDKDVGLDLVMDATLFLWSKCRPIFQKYQNPTVESSRFMQKLDNPNTVDPEQIEFTLKSPTLAWIYLLDMVHQVGSWCGLSCVDPVMMSEVTLRLALVYESCAKLEPLQGDKDHNFSNSQFVGMQASPRELLQKARQVLKLGLSGINCARRSVAQALGHRIADVALVKEFLRDDSGKEIFEEKPHKPGTESPDNCLPEILKGSGLRESMWNTMKDLQVELIFVYHRVCLKLSALGSGDTPTKSAKKQVRQCLANKQDNPSADVTNTCVEDLDELISQCKKNHLSKALLLAQRALSLGTGQGPTSEQKKLLEDAVSLIQRVQIEEKKIYLDNTSVQEKAERRKVPPPPLLLCRTDTFMVFKPAPFKPESGQKVACYSLYARCASDKTVKVRLNDRSLPGTGEEIPAGSFCEMRVMNLEPNERYMFAVAAYTKDGQLIGESIGETTRPVLACHPLSVLMAWALVSQAAYQVGYHSVSSQASNVVWDYFVVKPQPESAATYITELKKDFRISLLTLKQKAVFLSSPALLRQFLTSIFINTDVAVKEGQLFCDILCEKGMYYNSQIQRLRHCERMLVAIELAGWLNEANLALQAVVQIYGLLAPMLYHKIPSISILQILQRCSAVLQEIPKDMIQRRQSPTFDSLSHMIVCITYHLAKVLKANREKDIADVIVESGYRLLGPDSKNLESKVEEEIDAPGVKQIKFSKVVKEGKNTKEVPANEDIRALEAYLLSVNQPAAGEELRGNEDPVVLNAYIACLPSYSAFKEVAKFKDKPNYLEYLVQVSQKGLGEGLAEEVAQWCDEGVYWLNRRNASLIGNKMAKQTGAVTVTGDKKYAATMVEYKKPEAKGGKTEKSTGPKQAEKKRVKYKPLLVTASMSETAIKQQEEKELKAVKTLNHLFVDIYKDKVKRRTFRKTVATETPWRSQLNAIQGLSHFYTLLKKFGARGSLSVKRTNMLDPEWFCSETAGAMVVGWPGGPSHYPFVKDVFLMSADKEYERLQSSQTMLSKTKAPNLMELAAAAVIGIKLRPPAQSENFEASNSGKQNGAFAGPDGTTQEEVPLLTPDILMEALRKTFTHFKKAVVLAHRGQHWTLLQNAARTMWNCAYTMLSYACTADLVSEGSGLLTIEMLWTLLWQPFYIASDCLLDMLTILQDPLGKQTVKCKSKIMGEDFESWMGNIQSELGGASLKFDPLLDNISRVDVRWVRRLVLRTLELLYSQEKHEKLVDVALRFNALTKNRYAEQVIPIIVQSQRFLEKRIKQVGGPAPPQPHFRALQAQLGHVIQAQDFFKAQLKVQIDREVPVQSGVQIDLNGQGVYTKQDSFCLSAVPLDTIVSLKELQLTLDQSHYTARALKHSRKLLCLYLAGLQNGEESLLQIDPKKVSEQPHPIMPPNKITLDGPSSDVTQFINLPITQIEVVISSYEKTIELLRAKNHKSVSAQAMHELGNILFYSKNARAALQWWSQALDVVLKVKDAIHTWRSSLWNVTDISACFLDRCGLWGCLLAGVLASNIAQYCLTEDFGLRAECCLLSGYLFKSLFRCSLPHPSADRDYALYYVGEGYEMTYLCPGVDFLSDKFRCDGRQLVAALKWVTKELARAQYNLFVLPLLTLSQYFSLCMCRDVQQVVSGRILRVRVLTDLGLFTEAIIVLQQLMNGEHLPETNCSSFRQPEVKETSGYSSSKTAADTSNLKVIESLIHRRLPNSLATLFGPHLTCHLALVQAHLLVSLAKTIPVIPKIGISFLGKKEKAGPQSAISRGPPIDTSRNAADGNDCGFQNFFKEGEKNPPLDVIKGVMLAASELMVTTMMSVIFEKSLDVKLEELPAAELELVVQCLLEQTYIAQQRQHAPLAAHTVLQALKMLQHVSDTKKPQLPLGSGMSLKSTLKSDLKTEEIQLPKAEELQYQYQNLQARLQLDTRLWMLCKRELIRSLTMEVRGLGEMKGSEEKVVSDVADCRQYCAEGMSEAEAMRDTEMQAHFLFLGAQLNIIEAKRLKHTVSLLEDAIKRLQLIPHRSGTGEQLLATCIMFGADMEAIDNSSDLLITQKTLKCYLNAQKIILKEMEMLGERIQHKVIEGQEPLSVPLSPLQNVYLPHVQSLVQVKLRIGNAMARDCAKQDKNSNKGIDLSLLWTNSLTELVKALEISQVSASRDVALESEILLLIGKVQKMLVYFNKCEARAAARTLLRAVKISHSSRHDLGLMRQAYLEMALIFMNCSDLSTLTDGLQFMATKNMDEIFQETATKTPDPTKTKDAEMKEHQSEIESTTAWLAVRCATVVAYAQQSRSMITGDPKVISHKMNIKTLRSLPEFFILDLFSRTVLGTAHKTFKSDIEEELAPLVESGESKVFETHESLLNKVKAAATDVSWIHLLGYQTILKHLVNTASISVSSKQTNESKNTKESGRGLDAGQASHDAGINYDVVRYMLLSVDWSVRLANIHSFLQANLTEYANSCCAPYPPEDFTFQKLPGLSTEPSKHYGVNTDLSFDSEALIASDAMLNLATLEQTPGSSHELAILASNLLPKCEAELSVQWYQPGLEEDRGFQDATSGAVKTILLLYVHGSRTSRLIQGIRCLALHEVYSLHYRLSKLAHKLDIATVAKNKQDPLKYATQKSSRKATAEQESKLMTPKLGLDERFEVLYRQYLQDAWALIKGPNKLQEAIVPEFNPVNVKNLKSLFDPSLGITLQGTDLMPWLLQLLT